MKSGDMHELTVSAHEIYCTIAVHVTPCRLYTIAKWPMHTGHTYLNFIRMCTSLIDIDCNVIQKSGCLVLLSWSHLNNSVTVMPEGSPTQFIACQD